LSFLGVFWTGIGAFFLVLSKDVPFVHSFEEKKKKKVWNEAKNHRIFATSIRTNDI